MSFSSNAARIDPDSASSRGVTNVSRRANLARDGT
jgi:hypothetical protein